MFITISGTRVKLFFKEENVIFICTLKTRDKLFAQYITQVFLNFFISEI